MPDLNSVLPPPYVLEPAATGRRQYLELYGHLKVQNHQLRIAVMSLALVAVGLVFVAFKAIEASERLKPLVIRISESGDAKALPYSSFEYTPQDREIKYFLIRFVEMHFGRMRATLKENFARSLLFLDAPLASAVMDEDKKSRAIESTLAGQTDECDIEVKSVAVQDLRQNPYRATVEYDRVYFSGHRESRRQRFIGNFVFTFSEKVPNSHVPVNPLGLTITYFREDQAYK